MKQETFRHLDSSTTYYYDEADYLGPANAEQRAEIRKSWRTWFRRILHAAHVIGVITAVVVAGAVLIGVGLVLGATNSDLVLEVLR